MMNNIAVILRGHCRTFRFIHHKIFEFYDSISTNVDYYFASWTSSLEDVNIPYIFESNNKNLITIKYFNDKENSNIRNGYLGPSHMCYSIVPHKRIREKTVSYDMVFETRPDVLPFMRPKQELVPFMMEDNTLYVSHIEIHKNSATQKREVAVPDWFLISDSRTFDIMSQRFLCNTHIGAQMQYIHYAKSENINLGICYKFDSIIVRPNRKVINYDLPWNLVSEQLWEGNATWEQSSNDEKKSILRDLNILETDYLTGPNGCLR